MYSTFDFDFESAIFEWDDNKDRLNFAKHGIHFKTASKVFLDPFKLIRADEEHSEERYNVIGKIGRVIFVVCIFKDNSVVRIISARLASIPEKERYELGKSEF